MDVGAHRAIEVAGLEKRYGDRRAVDGISFTIAAGEVFGLLGPERRGQDHDRRDPRGLPRPDAGTVRVLGLDPAADGREPAPAHRRDAPGGRPLPGRAPARGAAPLRRVLRRTRRPRAAARPRRPRATRGARYVRRLSGGQCQRLSLALALVGRPEVVFLDEPTAGMDPHARATTWQLVRDLRDAGTTVVLTTHHMDEAEHLCDRLAIIDRGRHRRRGDARRLTNRRPATTCSFSTAPGLDLPALAAALEPRAPTGQRGRDPGEYTSRAAMTPDARRRPRGLAARQGHHARPSCAPSGRRSKRSSSGSPREDGTR